MAEQIAMTGLGIYSWFGYDIPLKERLALMKKAGFSSTILWWGDSLADYYGKKEDLIAMVKDSGLFLENIHVPYENTNHIWYGEKSAREILLQQNLSWIEDCAQYQIPGMVMHINNGDVLPPLEEEFLDFFRILAQKAKECQITLALENVLRNDYVEAILKAPGCENLRLCYDSSHDQLAQKFIDYPPYQLLEKLPQKVAFLHLSDNKGNRDSHWLPGHGILNWHQICRNLAQAGFSGQITLEITPSAKEKALSAGEFLDLAYHSIVAIISDEKNSQYFAHPINQDGI